MRMQVKVAAETVAMVALAGALFLIRFQMPQGGEVTLASMVPILVLAFRRGPRIGILAGMAFGLVVLVEEPFIYHPIQFLLDYPLAFGSLGLAGFFRNLRWPMLPTIGVAVGIGGRFLCHFISGLVFFASYAPAGMNPALYSAIYNGAYLIPELFISEIITCVLVWRGVLKIYM